MPPGKVVGVEKRSRTLLRPERTHFSKSSLLVNVSPPYCSRQTPHNSSDIGLGCKPSGRPPSTSPGVPSKSRVADKIPAMHALTFSLIKSLRSNLSRLRNSSLHSLINLRAALYDVDLLSKHDFTQHCCRESTVCASKGSGRHI